ncbi:hypothetical protein NDU88_003259 [Pleurodeles waltl]|uniref:Uncharacterized protein n=1 Tax=Pleurodeles waltl TaxID=8319 RepID=A0AAV7PCK1_PLEWA|nr:hypothetical protein NDU88_003259 [Pleurodeles waltl]
MWRFGAWYLKDPECVQFTDQGLTNYFRENRGSVALAEILWAASEPALRGSIKGNVKRREAQQITELEMAELERRTGPLGRVEAGRQLELWRAKFRQVSLAEALQHWQASTQRVYELGDKPGKLVYRLANCDISARGVPLIRDWGQA